jgi:HlyD family secretion protein
VNKKILIFLIIMLILGAAGALYYFKYYLPSQVEPTPAFNSSKVRIGDIVITTSGVGNLIPTETVTIGFQINGILQSLNIDIGDAVDKGDILATLDDADARLKMIQAEANLHALFSPSALNQAELSLINAKINYNNAQDDLVDLIGLDAFNLEVALADAQSTLDELRADAGSSEEEIKLAEEALVLAEENLIAAQPAYESEDAVRLARVKLQSAEFAVSEAETYLSVLQNGLDRVDFELSASSGSALIKLQQAKWEYDKALADLEKTIIKAPISGTVTEVNASVGQAVTNSTSITISTLDDMRLKFYIEERDISLLQIGKPVEVIFDAYQNIPVTGSITTIEPSLTTFEGSSVAVVWAVLSNPIDFPLLPGMSADVEVIAAETRDALLIPIQALREISPGSYSVFVVQPDESLRMVVVTVGLQDFANAEILSGLKQGDVISTGAVETK